jgi:tetratricopeptide (TPR) repeat protein
MFSRIFLGFLLLMTLVGNLAAQDSPRALYDAGKFQEALDLLNKNGLQTAADYYDAANCLYRLGKVGQALGYYEKANTLAPGNEDIRYNLGIAEGAVSKAGGILKDQRLWIGRIVPIFKNVSEELADILLALATIGFAALAYRYKKTGMVFTRAVLRPAFLATFGAWALTCALVVAVVTAHHAQLAAIIADMSVARSGPAETFTELFKLPAGSKVELTGESRDGWQQVRFSLGNVGWIMDKELLPL